MKKKFTMVELLGVMIVITILVTIGVSVANVVFRKAAESRTLATLRRVQLAVEEVKNKHGYYPYTRTSKNTNIINKVTHTSDIPDADGNYPQSSINEVVTPDDYSVSGERDGEYTILLLGGLKMQRAPMHRMHNGTLTTTTGLIWPGERISKSTEYQIPRYPQNYIIDFRNVIGQIRLNRNVKHDGVGNLMFVDDWGSPLYYRAPGGKYYGDDYDLYSCGYDLYSEGSAFHQNPMAAAGFNTSTRTYTARVYNGNYNTNATFTDIKDPYATVNKTFKIRGLTLWTAVNVNFLDMLPDVKKDNHADTDSVYLKILVYKYAMQGLEPVFDTVDGNDLGVKH